MEWIIKNIELCDSTNSLVKQLKAENEIRDKTAILTEFQTNGRGQGGNYWHSKKKVNLLTSIFSKTSYHVSRHFLITISTSLAIYDSLKTIGIDTRIKWPNDIYYLNKKIAGILIENTILGNTISETVLGIGLNVNQNDFPGDIPNPVSISSILQKDFDIETLLKLILEKLSYYLDNINENISEDFYHKYISLLFRLNSWSVFRVKQKNFNGIIRGVLPDGKLIVETDGGQLKEFLFGDIQFVI